MTENQEKSTVSDHVLIPGSDAFQMMERQFKTKAAFIPFRDMPQNLLWHVLSETICMPINRQTHAFTTETRLMVDDAGDQIGGYTVQMDIPWDDHHPCQLKPFLVRALWLPEADGDLFIGSEPVPTFMCRDNEGCREILFPIHPKSERMYQPLFEEYPQPPLHLPAIALSSCRTLLLALPRDGGGWRHIIVKVSIDQEIAGRRRIIQPSGCAFAVANTTLLKHRSREIRDIGFLKEPVAFAPLQSLVAEDGERRNAGFIYREMPEPLAVDGADSRFYVPLFALFGQQNRSFFEALIHANGGSATDFLIDRILEPFARSCVELLYFQRVCIEAHAQNLLLSLDPHLRVKELIYRDMGGVNCLVSDVELNQLPVNQQSKNNFYFDTHFKDAAITTEECFVAKILFNITKQLSKSVIGSDDFHFSQWKSSMLQQGFLGNWTTGDGRDDAHEDRIHVHAFYRYGYAERIFAGFLLDEIDRRGIFTEIERQRRASHSKNETLISTDIASELAPTQSPYSVSRSFFEHLLDVPPAGYRSPCIDRYWFKELILTTASLFARRDL